MARMNFNTLFNVDQTNGTIEPRQRIRIGGVTFGPGVKFGGGVAFSGIDLSQYVGHDLEVETDNDVFVITGIY